MAAAAENKNGKSSAQEKFDSLMSRFANLCVQLGELEYHYVEVLPRRRKELVKEMNELQKQASRCKVMIEGKAAGVQDPQVGTKPETSEQS